MNDYERHAPRSDEPQIPNAYFESLLRLRIDNPSAFRLLSPALLLAVGYYEKAKEAAERKRAAELGEKSKS